MNDTYRYWAFISYSHADEAWAKWLHKALETYRVPMRLVGTTGAFGPRPRRLFPVFRDRDELSSAAELSSVIEAALRESRYQIVICSPNGARSQWVDAEVRRFKSLGRESRVLALIVDGEPHAADPATECFPLALKRHVDRHAQITATPAEPIAADARPFADHKHGARLKLISGILEVGYDELRQRERQRRFWQRVHQVAAGFAAIALLAGMTVWFEHREARVLEQTRLDRLVHLGRQELHEQRNARAAVYFVEALKGGRDTLPLRYWLARAMQPVDAVEPRVVRLDIPIVHAAPTPDGRHLFSVSANRATLHAMDSGARVHETSIAFEAFMGRPRIAADGRFAVISGARSSKASAEAIVSAVLDLDSGQVRASLPGLMWPGYGEVLSPDGRHLLLGVQPPPDSADKPHIEVRELPDGRLAARLDSPDGTAVASYSPDGRRIVTGGEGRGEIRIWDARNYQLLRVLQPRQAMAHSAYWTGRGSELMSISEAGAIKLWDADSGELLDALGSHSLFAMAADAAAARYWVTSSIDGTQVWDLEKGQALLTTDRFGGLPPEQISLDRRGAHLLATESETGSLWNVAERAREHFLDVHAGPVAAQFFVDDDRTIVSVASNGSIRRLHAAALRLPRARLEHGDYVNPVERPGVYVAQLAEDRDAWISGGSDGTVRLWRQTDGEARAHLRGHDATVVEITQADGLIVSADSSGRIVAWDGSSAGPAWSVETAARIDGLRPTPGGKRLLVLHQDAGLQWLDASDGALLSTMTLPAPMVAAIPLDDDGQALLIDALGALSRIAHPTGTPTLLLDTAGADWFSDLTPLHDAGLIAQTDGRWLRTVKLAEASVDQRIDVDRLVERPVYLRELSTRSDGRLVAAGTLEGPIVLWRPGEDRVRLLEGHGDAVATITHDPAGRLLASASRSGEIILWDLESGQPLQRLRVAREAATILAFDADGTRLLSNERLGNALRLWDISLEQRPLEQIELRIRCAVPWRLQGLKLAPHNPQPRDCAAATSGTVAG